MSQLKKGAILSYVNILLTNFIGLLITPLIIKTLGDSEYGLYTLIGSLIGYISVLDFGLNNSIVRFVAKYRAENDRKGEENFLASTMIIYFIISILVILIGIVLYFNLDYVFGKTLTSDEIYKSKIMFIILIANMAITLPGGAFSAICSGYEQFVFPRALNIIKYIIRSILVVSILLLGSDSLGLVILDTIMNLAVIFLNGYFVFKKLNVKFKLHEFNYLIFKQIFSYSFWIFLFAMVGQMQWKAGQVILGAVSGTKAVAIYGVGIMLGTYYGAFSTAISGVFLPRATKMSFQNATNDQLTSMMIKVGRVSFMVLLLIFGGYFLYGRQFVNLWVGATYNDSWMISVIIMAAYTLPLVQAFANSLLEAKSLFSFKAIIYISFIFLGTAFGYLLIDTYSVIGLIIGSTFGWVISQIIMNIYYFKVLGLQIPRFFKELLNNIFLVFLVSLAIGYTFNFISGSGWINLLIKIMLFIVLFSLLMFKFGMNKTEKDMIKSVIPNFLKFKKYDS